MSKKRIQKTELSKPIVSSFLCMDHDPIEEWAPVDPFNVDIWMGIYFIGPDDKPSGEYFTVHIITVKRVRQMKNFRKKYAIVLDEYSWDTVCMKIDKILDGCHGYTWQEMTDKLRKHFHWEYEGMT